VALTDLRGEDPLADRRVVALVLRVVIDGQGRVLHGEVVEATANRTQRFAGWAGLIAAVREALSRSASAAQPEGPEGAAP
jgi:hypothetical protein